MTNYLMVETLVGVGVSKLREIDDRQTLITDFAN